jgi:hypothetical protein
MTLTSEDELAKEQLSLDKAEQKVVLLLTRNHRTIGL